MPKAIGKESQKVLILAVPGTRPGISQLRTFRSAGPRFLLNNN